MNDRSRSLVPRNAMCASVPTENALLAIMIEGFYTLRVKEA